MRRAPVPPWDSSPRRRVAQRPGWGAAVPGWTGLSSTPCEMRRPTACSTWCSSSRPISLPSQDQQGKETVAVLRGFALLTHGSLDQGAGRGAERRQRRNQRFGKVLLEQEEYAAACRTSASGSDSMASSWRLASRGCAASCDPSSWARASSPCLHASTSSSRREGSAMERVEPRWTELDEGARPGCPVGSLRAFLTGPRKWVFIRSSHRPWRSCPPAAPGRPVPTWKVVPPSACPPLIPH